MPLKTVAVAVRDLVDDPEISDAGKVQRVVVGVQRVVCVVPTGPTVDIVAIGTADDRILIIAAHDAVGTRAAVQAVAPCAAIERVAVRAAQKGVVTGTTVDDVVTFVAHQQVVPGTGPHRTTVNRRVEVYIGNIDAARGCPGIGLAP